MNRSLRIIATSGILACFIALTWLVQKKSMRSDPSPETKESREAAQMALKRAGLDPGHRGLTASTGEAGMLTYRIRGNEKGPVAFRATGNGLYGEAAAVVVVDDKKGKILGVDIYRDAASPGYGLGLLTSGSWTESLEGQPLFPPATGEPVHKRRKKSIDGVSGATLSLKAASRFNEVFNASISGFVGGGIELVPLELDLGVDAITRATPGYPRGQVKPPHLKAEIRRPAFLVPPGTRLLSEGKPVTSGMDTEPIIGELEQVTDGIKTCTEFDYVELDAGPQWVQIDLLKEELIYLVVIWHYYRNPVIYNDVIVQLSNDPEFRRGVVTVYNTDHDNSTGEGAGKDSACYARWWGEFADARGPAFTGVPARYVRVYTNGGTGMEETRFVEIEVYGK